MKLKGILYAPPATGKSVFANAIPNRCFITTDGNYHWLEDFGADPKDEFHVSTWVEFKELVSDLSKFDKYDAIVVDLIEDLASWAEYEFCKKNKFMHISDAGGYGRGYDIIRTEVLIELSKLIGLDKNIIFLSHEKEETKKDSRGIEYSKKSCSGKISGKLYDGLNGQLDFILRAGSEYIEKVNDNGDTSMELVRYISLMPNGKTELGSIRHIDTNKLPNTIALDWDELVNVFIECKPSGIKKASRETLTNVNAPKKQVVTTGRKASTKQAQKVEPVVEEVKEATEVNEVKKAEDIDIKEKIKLAKEKIVAEKEVEESATDDQNESFDNNKNVSDNVVSEQPTKPMSAAERLAAIRAKAAAAMQKN